MRHETNFKSDLKIGDVLPPVQLNLMDRLGDCKPKARKPKKTVDERFNAKVLFAGPDDCWLWRGGTSSGSLGYGNFNENGEHVYAHRYAWKRKHGPIPAGICILHRCDNPLCVNDAHMRLGTDGDNSKDKVAKGRHKRGRRMTGTDAIQLVQRFAYGWSFEKLATAYQMSVHSVRLILSGKTWAKYTGIVFAKGVAGKYEQIRAELRQRFELTAVAA
jgi:hypothetical protein